MKNIVFIFMIIIQFSCHEKPPSSDKTSNSSDRITIRYMDFNTTTTLPVPCNYFDRESDIDSILLTDKEIESVKFFVEKFLADSTKDINTRGKIIFLIDKKKTEYCFDKFGIFQKADKSFRNPDLFKFIKERNPFEKKGG